MIFRPDFYDCFRCLASACRHSCCRGWEIDVDDDSADAYRRLGGDLGRALERALFEDEGGWHFRLDPEERCPFLRRDGLCRLICELGEEALCDICALHPRFFQELGEHELWGLGLSCEAVSGLLWQGEGPLLFLSDVDETPLDFPALLEALGLDFPRPLLRHRPHITRERIEQVCRAMADTEPIDGHWVQEVAATAAVPPPSGDPFRGREGAWQRVYQYWIYRQLERLEDFGPQALADYAGLCLDYLLLQPGDPEQSVRRLSEQIEYSTENVDRIVRSAAHSI